MYIYENELGRRKENVLERSKENKLERSKERFVLNFSGIWGIAKE